MDLHVQRRIAAEIFDCSKKHVSFDAAKLETIKEALTRADIKDLINSNVIQRKRPNEQSRIRARKIAQQKSKGLRKGVGSRKGTAKVRSDTRQEWQNKVRLQRAFIKELKDKQLIAAKTYRDLYGKVKGNFFRNKRHIKLHLEEFKLFTKNGK